jgi:predicted TPR repeat methyltransferase
MSPERAPETFARSLFESIGEGPGWEAVARLAGYGGGEWLRKLFPSLAIRNSILDLGCADGYLGSRLREWGYRGRLVGVDACATLLERCRATGLYDECFLCDVARPWPELGAAGFDLAIAFGLTEFISQHGLFLSRVSAALAAESELWITFEDSVGNPQPYAWKSLQTESGVVRLLREAGFGVVSIDRVEAGRCVHRLPDQSLEVSDSFLPYLLAVARRPTSNESACADSIAKGGHRSTQSMKP